MKIAAAIIFDVSFSGERWGDLYYWVSDIGKANKLLGWEPQILPDKGIRDLMDWVRQNLHIFQDG